MSMNDNDEKRVIRVAHRGGAGHAPENTLDAIEKSISFGADYIEIDIQKSIDGHLVVMHDKRVDRTTNGSGYITQMTLEEIRSLDAGNGERIPLLAEVLESADGRIGVIIEMITPGIAGSALELVSRISAKTPIIFASFIHPELVVVRETDSRARTMALLEGVPVSGARFATEASATHVGLCFDSVTREFVEVLKSEGLGTFVYTLNDTNDIELARKLGVDGIISDYPERI